MKKTTLNFYRSKQLISVSAAVIFLSVGLILLPGLAADSRASNNSSSLLFIPLVYSDSRLAPVPSIVASIPLEGARCPKDMSFNSFSGDLYITNEDSDNVSIIRDQSFLRNISTGNRPIHVESDPNSSKVYVSHLWSGISILEGDSISAHIPQYGESYNITTNSVNNYTYVTDLYRPITIIQDSTKVKDLFVPDFNGQTIVWQLASDFDRLTGLTYFASWQYGAMTVVEGTEVTDQYSFHGEGASDMIVDSHRRLIVVANARAQAESNTLNNISIVDLNTKGVTAIFSAKYSSHIDFDPVTGYVYVTNPSDDTVTVLQGKMEVATYQTGKKPWDVAVDPITGYAYVTNSEEHSVSVFKDGVPVTTIDLPEDKGFEPWKVTIDEESGRVYILDRSSIDKPSYREKQVVECRKPWVHILE